MAWVRLNVELVTPCFLAGAAGGKQSARDLQDEGLRPASLIGQWRYWLRAALGHTRDWQDRESALFGSQHGGGHQGRVRVRQIRRGDRLRVWGRDVKIDEIAEEQYTSFRDGAHDPVDPLIYLLGQGVCNTNGILQRACLRATQSATVEVSIRETPDAQRDWADLRQALWLWQTFGAIGARSRRGWGNVRITGIQGVEKAIAFSPEEQQRWQQWFALETWNDDSELQLRKRIADIYSGVNTSEQRLAFTHHNTDPRDDSAITRAGEEPFSHLASSCVVISKNAYGSWAKALAELGRVMLHLRNNIHGRKRPKEQFRVLDHDMVHNNLAHSVAMPHAPYRSAFGLPHNYYFTSLPRGRNSASFQGPTNGETRRASPLFLRVYRTASANGGRLYVPVALWLKSRLTTNHKIRGARTTVDAPDWRAVVEYLNCLRNVAQEAQGAVRTQAAAVPQMPQTDDDKRPLQPGQTRKGLLNFVVFRYMAKFPALNKTEAISNPNDIPKDTPDLMPAEFLIEKTSPRVSVKFLRVMGAENLATQISPRIVPGRLEWRGSGWVAVVQGETQPLQVTDPLKLLEHCDRKRIINAELTVSTGATTSAEIRRFL
jgi:CRISPR-associated protein Cmr1